MKSGKAAELVLLDHGLYEELPQQVRLSLGNMWRCIVMRDYAGMKLYSTQLGVNGELLTNNICLKEETGKIQQQSKLCSSS
jgi:predicted unusual protein kinase regulating ubiquinone biosynthesis (AarF/ABC1/UbiB family)